MSCVFRESLATSVILGAHTDCVKAGSCLSLAELLAFPLDSHV